MGSGLRISERQEEAGKTRLDQLESADCSMLWSVSLAEARVGESESREGRGKLYHQS